MKLFKTNDKEIILKTIPGKMTHSIQGKKIRMTSDFCLKTMQANGAICLNTGRITIRLEPYTKEGYLSNKGK